MPGRWIPAGPADASVAPGKGRCRVNVFGQRSRQGGRRSARFALPCLETLHAGALSAARRADAEDAVQECYLARAEAFRHLSRTCDQGRGCLRSCAMSAAPNMPDAPARRPAASTNCRDRRTAAALAGDAGDAGGADRGRWDADTVRRLIAALTEPFRETFVLREIENCLTARSRTSPRCPWHG